MSTGIKLFPRAAVCAGSQAIVCLVFAGLLVRSPTTGRADNDPPRSKFNRELAVGDPAPDFEGLLGTDGKRHSLADLQASKVVVVMFIRNLCPTTHAYEARLIEFAKAMSQREVSLIAISVSRNPAERLDRLAARAKAKGYLWTCVHDESQFVGRAYGATVTPQFFVLDSERRIAYMGAFDDDLKGERITRRFVAEAVESLLAGEVPETTETLARGCEIEFHRGDE